MKNSTNSILCDVILDILEKGEYTTGDIQQEIRYWHKEVYDTIERRTDKKGKKSPFSKYVDGALQHLKKKKKVEKASYEHGSPWKLV